MQEVLRFRPLYQERVWGGRVLESELQRALPADRPIGESWELVDRPEAQSVIEGGRWDGRTLRSVIEERPAAVMGPSWSPHRPFPILVKWLDCRERLSLQVHPPAAVAGELKGEPKTENWYIAQTTSSAQLIVGLKRGVTRDQFERAISDNILESCVHRFPVSRGDSILVHSGQVHAIDGGNLILEIQQNSDTTYRVYDWGRVGLDGRPRQLHVPQSLRSINWNDFEPAPTRAELTSAVIADCAEFRIRRVVFAAGEQITLRRGEQPRIASIVTGDFNAGAAGGPNAAAPAPVTLRRGDNVLVPFAAEVVLTAKAAGVLLLTENFSP